jgi:biopolymer transport protein TolQ
MSVLSERLDSSTVEAVSVAVGSGADAGGPGSVNLNPVDMVLHSTGPVFVVFWLLVVMAAMTWAISIMKAFQLARLRGALRAFEREAFNLVDAKDLFETAARHQGSPGGRVVIALSRRGGSLKVLESVARRAVIDEQQRAGKMMTLLASIASSAPFIGLFGTVWGILDAFLRIGREKSASLPVVAPAIGEALITTAVGLFAAIPALIFYNLLNRRLDDLVSELEAASDAWVTLVSESDQGLGVPADRTVSDARTRAASNPPHAGYAGR